MKRYTLWLVSGTLIALAVASSPASAAAFTCTAPTAPIQKPLPLVPVTPTLTWLSPIGPCAPGPTLVSVAPACPAPPFVGPTPGEFCGPLIPPGGFAICMWLPGPAFNQKTLYAGFDADLDGHILIAPSGETPVFGPLAPGISWMIPNTYPVPARVIAYPTSLTGAPLLGDVNLVMCI